MEKTKQQKTLNIEMYNANYEEVLLSTISDNNPLHSGRVNIQTNKITITDKSGNVTYANLFNEEGIVNKIRLQHNLDVFDFYTRKFELFGKQVNISSYFSLHQYQTGILEIKTFGKFKEIDFKIPLKHREFCKVVYFQDSPNPTFNAPLTKLPEVYVVINNTNNEVKRVNILDLAQNKNIPKGIVVENNYFEESDKDLKFDLLRVWSKNNSQLQVLISENQPNNRIEAIEPAKYLTHDQHQSIGIDIKKTFKINKTSEIMVDIHPNTRVMYHFS